MKNYIKLLCLLLFFSCSKDDSVSTTDSFNEDNLTGFLNLYPLIESVSFTSVNNTLLNDNQLVGVVRINSNLLVFPYSFFDQYEVINVEYLGKKFTVSYCPLTKSCIAFERDHFFRASGYLYNNNLAPWDEKTETIWSQMLMKGLIGEKKNTGLSLIPVVQTNWGTIKVYYPSVRILDSNIIISSGKPPENPDDTGDDSDVILPSSGDLTYGVVSGSSVSMFQFSDFSTTPTLNVTINSQKHIVYANSGRGVINAFKVDDFNDYTVLNNDFPYVLQNSIGVKFDIFGIGTNGSRLELPNKAYVAAWWGWEGMFNSFLFQ